MFEKTISLFPVMLSLSHFRLSNLQLSTFNGTLAIANSNNVSLFISIHIGSNADKNVTGTKALVYSLGTTSDRIAQNITKNLNNTTIT